MKHGARGGLFASWLLAFPVEGVAQNPALVDSFRPYLYVLVAFAAGWLFIAAWVFLIGRRMIQLSRLVDETRDP